MYKAIACLSKHFSKLQQNKSVVIKVYKVANNFISKFIIKNLSKQEDINKWKLEYYHTILEKLHI